MTLKSIVICTITCIALVGCSNKVKEKIGFATSGPDEYMITRSKGLEVPPQFSLPNPSDSADIPQYEASDRDMDKAEQELMQEIDSNLR